MVSLEWDDDDGISLAPVRDSGTCCNSAVATPVAKPEGAGDDFNGGGGYQGGGGYNAEQPPPVDNAPPVDQGGY